MDDLTKTLKIVREIKIDHANGMNRSQLYQKYEDFATNKPKTFNQTVDGNFNEEVFISLCKVYQSKPNKLDGTIAMGEMMAEKFLYPKIGKPSDENREKAVDAMNMKIAENNAKLG
jgi:hypothetical protein